MADKWGNTITHSSNQWRTGVRYTVVSETNADITYRIQLIVQTKWKYSTHAEGTIKATNTNVVSGSTSKSWEGTLSQGVNGTSSLGNGQIKSYASFDVKYSKKHSAYNVTFSANYKVTGGYGNGTSKASVSVSIKARPSYTVGYNANGGSGAPSSQTKWYGETLKLSATKPSRTGHDFLYWTTDFGSGTVKFNPGGSYTQNSKATLYANWEAHTYPVKYDANGGEGAPAAQTKTYGKTLKLSSTIPTRKNYNFLGWGTSSNSTTVSYAAGADYTNNTAVTLYAVWELAWIEPQVTNFQAVRCNASGTLNEEGTYAKVSFNWKTDKNVAAISIVCNNVTTPITATGTSGSVSTVIGAGALSIEENYTVTLNISDTIDSISFTTVVPSMKFIIDIAPNGSVSFGEPADPDTKRLDVYIPAIFNNVILRNNQALAANTNSGGTTSLLRLNASNVTEFTWTSGGLRGRCSKTIWSGTAQPGANLNISEAMYYNVFAGKTADLSTPILIGIRQNTGGTGSEIVFYGVRLTNSTKYVYASSAVFQSIGSGTTWNYKYGATVGHHESTVWNGLTILEIRGLL